jgi:hypothetical protein
MTTLACVKLAALYFIFPSLLLLGIVARISLGASGIAIGVDNLAKHNVTDSDLCKSRTINTVVFAGGLVETGEMAIVVCAIVTLTVTSLCCYWVAKSPGDGGLAGIGIGGAFGKFYSLVFNDLIIFN